MKLWPLQLMLRSPTKHSQQLLCSSAQIKFRIHWGRGLGSFSCFSSHVIITNRMPLYNKVVTAAQRWVDTRAISVSHCIWRSYFFIFGKATMKEVVVEYTIVCHRSYCLLWQLLYFLLCWSVEVIDCLVYPPASTRPKSCCWLKWFLQLCCHIIHRLTRHLNVVFIYIPPH